MSVDFHGAALLSSSEAEASSALAAIVPEAFTCFNLGGTDQHGNAFKKDFSLASGDTGSLWIGVDLPMGAFGRYVATFTVGTNTSAPRTLTVELNVTSGAVEEHGDDDVYNLSRLRWLDSTIGVDGDAVWPRSRFANITAASIRGVHGQGGDDEESGSGSGFTLSTVNKDIAIGVDGLPLRVTVRTVKQRRGKNVTRSLEVLAKPVQLLVLDSHGKPLEFAVSAAATVTNRTARAVSWTSKVSAGGVEVMLTGRLEMDSYLTFEAMLSSSGTATAVSDVQLVVAAEGSTARRMLGMGSIGAPAASLEWRWQKVQGVGNNRLWLGDVDAGVFVTPRGAGDDWVSPTYGKDYPVYPFLPTSWAGAGAANANSSIYGANVTLQHDLGSLRNTTPAAVVCTIFSGPRQLTRSSPTQFLFDMMFTPAHALDLASHWKSRYLQIGYGGVQYTTPAAVAATGVTVATLHQGIGGVHNGTMVNPYLLRE